MLQDLKDRGEAPEWMTIEGYQTMSKGYLLEGETPRAAYMRVCRTVAKRLGKPELADKFFSYIWRGWLGLASPVLANTGNDKGLPISCYSTHVPDSIDGIYSKVHEMACLTKGGGGVGVYMGDVRGRGAPIKGGLNGFSDGIIPWAKVFDSAILATNQGSTRRGAAALYLDSDHPDLEEFMRIRRPQGDVNRQCLNLHHGVCLDDDFMKSLKEGNKHNRKIWEELLRTRLETGEPYIFFSDTVNRLSPPMYQDRGMRVKTSNICSEIVGYTDEEHTFVCCLSSLNLSRWDEWKDSDLPYYATIFLDGVLEDFIQCAEGISGMESALNFAKKGRMLGLGVFGFHTLLQEKAYTFGGVPSILLNREIFERIQHESDRASRDLAQEYGEPEWCKGYGYRNTHRMAIAPTVTNSKMAGYVSPSIEPWAANIYTEKSAKGTYIVKNRSLAKALDELGMNTPEVWYSITENDGSIAHLNVSEDMKSVFLTAREINQFDIVRLAADRQQYIDQAQSLNLFFPINSTARYIHEVHYKAWESGIKTLYYLRSNSVLKGDSGSSAYKREESDCAACEG